MTLGVALLLAVKDDDELVRDAGHMAADSSPLSSLTRRRACLYNAGGRGLQRDEKRSADATSLLLKNYVVDRLETVIDQGDQISHVKLAEEIDKAITDEKIMRKKVKLPEEVRADPFPPLRVRTRATSPCPGFSLSLFSCAPHPDQARPDRLVLPADHPVWRHLRAQAVGGLERHDAPLWHDRRVARPALQRVLQQHCPHLFDRRHNGPCVCTHPPRAIPPDRRPRRCC